MLVKQDFQVTRVMFIFSKALKRSADQSTLCPLPCSLLPLYSTWEKTGYRGGTTNSLCPSLTQKPENGIVGKILILLSGGIRAQGPSLSDSKSDKVKGTSYFSCLPARSTLIYVLRGVYFFGIRSKKMKSNTIPKIKDKMLNTRKDFRNDFCHTN